MVFLWFSYGFPMVYPYPDNPVPAIQLKMFLRRQSGDEVGSVEPPEAEASTTSCHDGRVAGVLSHGGTEHGKRIEKDGKKWKHHEK